MTNQEAYLAINAEKQKAIRGADESLEVSLGTWTEHLEQMGLAGGQIAGKVGTDKLRQMLAELESFSALTKQEKFNLVNLPEAETARGGSFERATLCDICLAVPSLREWTEQAEVGRLCQIVYKYKRVPSL
mmetsp:Transcript_17938/g.24093  ORF Transcript_17938/g.24093 Transcript_17938/m.24093 type:complete len:131 (+) Transcript_17938:45-437(+)